MDFKLINLSKPKILYYVTQQIILFVSVWTPVYFDHAGKGLMVSLNKSHLCEDTFMGAVTWISLIKTQRDHSTDFETYIIDETNTVVATVLISFCSGCNNIETCLISTEENNKMEN